MYFFFAANACTKKIATLCNFFCVNACTKKLSNRVIFFAVMCVTGLHNLPKKKRITRRDDFFVTCIYRKKKNTQITTYRNGEGEDDPAKTHGGADVDELHVAQLSHEQLLSQLAEACEAANVSANASDAQPPAKKRREDLGLCWHTPQQNPKRGGGPGPLVTNSLLW